MSIAEMPSRHEDGEQMEQSFGGNMRAIRLSMGISSMRQLAYFSGVDHSTVWNIENSKQHPSIKTACALGFALRLKGEDFFSFLNNGKPVTFNPFEDSFIAKEEETFIGKFKAYRLHKKASFRKVAVLSGLHTSSVYRMEDRNSYPHTSTLISLVSAMRLTLEQATDLISPLVAPKNSQN